MKICVLIPAYNCAHVIKEVIGRVVLPGPDDEIIVVDDGSADDTMAVASRLPRVHAVRNHVNLGYGGTSKRLYQLAMERDADFTINVHGDLGHRPEDIPPVLAPLLNGQYDIAVGSRLLYLKVLRRQSGLKTLLRAEERCNMPLDRTLGHFALTWFQNVCLGAKLHSYHEGMRACTRPVIEWIVKNQFSDWYNFDTDLIVRAHRQGFRIGEVPVKPFYHAEARTASPPWRYGVRTVIYTLQNLRSSRNNSTRSDTMHDQVVTSEKSGN